MMICDIKYHHNTLIHQFSQRYVFLGRYMIHYFNPIFKDFTVAKFTVVVWHFTTNILWHMAHASRAIWLQTDFIMNKTLQFPWQNITELFYILWKIFHVKFGLCEGQRRTVIQCNTGRCLSLSDMSCGLLNTLLIVYMN